MAASIFKRSLLISALGPMAVLAPKTVIAAQAPDSPLITGPNFQQIPASKIMVTPNGGSQMTLGAALAAGSGSGTVTPSPQYRVGIFPNSGTNSVIAGSSSITTDGSGNLNVGAMLNAGSVSSTGTVAASGLVDTGAGIISGAPSGGLLGSGTANITGAYNINGGEIINLFANEVSPILPSPGQNTVVATSSYFNRPQVIGHVETIDGTTPSTYAGSLTDQLTISGTMTNHWGEFIDQINVQAGGGTITGELNVRNMSINIGSGTSVHHGGAVEGQVQNSGTILSAINGFYTSFSNSSTGTIASPAVYYGFNDIWINNNTTAGAFWQHIAFHCNPMAGSGAAPTFNYCIKDEDPNGMIATIGTVSIGSVGSPQAGRQLRILAPNTSPTTFPLEISANGGVQNIILVRASGEVDMFGSLLSLGVDGSQTGNIVVASSTAGNRIQLNGGPGAFGGAFLAIGGTLPTGVPDSNACFTSAGVLISNTGCGAVPSTQLNNALTVSTLPTCNVATRGTTQMVSDANAPAYNTTLTGSGSAYVKAFCNGVNWVGG